MGPPQPNPDPPDNIRSLADTLLRNHIKLSVPRKLQPMAYQLLKIPAPETADSGVIVVVGAGASADTAGLPLGQATAKLLHGRLAVPKELLDAELERLSTQYRLEVNEFETQLLALGKFVGFQLANELAEIFDRKFYSAPFYEQLAHLFKHRYVDCIINFNFDELLDQAIDDELGAGNYWRILSDGDLTNNFEPIIDVESRRISGPLYVKPHGTASHRSSMRFTREAYFTLPEKIGELIKSCLSNHSMTLVVAGFGMQSVEFMKILEKSSSQSENETVVYLLSPSDEPLSRLPPSILENNRRHILAGDGSNPKLHKVIEKVWEKIKGNFLVSSSSLVRGMDRHNFIWLLFYETVKYEEPESNRYPSLETYLKDRLFAELSLAIAKAKGFVNIDQLSLSRAGQYYRHWLRHTKSPTTLYWFCNELGLKPVGYSRDALRLGVCVTAGDAARHLILPEDEWKTAKVALLNNLQHALSEPRAGVLLRHKSDFTDYLDAMYKGEEVEVSAPNEPIHHMTIERPIILTSILAAEMFTRDMLCKIKFNHLLCIAETGQWLIKDEIKQLILEKISVDSDKKIRITLIVADAAFEQSLKKEFGDILVVHKLPWWMHNQHMTIACNDEVPEQALYFERRRRSLTITPIGLSFSEDLNVALNTFLAYWVRSCRDWVETPDGVVVPDDISTARMQVFRESRC